MNIRTASLLTALLFLVGPLAIVSPAAAQAPVTDCIDMSGEVPAPSPENGECIAGDIPPAGTGACLEPVGLESDPVFAALCGAAVAAGFSIEPDVDHDLDGRADRATMVLPASPVSPYGCTDYPHADSSTCGEGVTGAPYECFAFSGWCVCPPGTTAVGDGLLGEGGQVWGDYVCLGEAPIYMTLDYFHNDADPDTPDEWYALAGPAADVAVDIMLYHPQTGALVNDGNGQRLSTLFSHGPDARYGPADFVLAIYAPDTAAADGANCIACVELGANMAPVRIVFGSGTSEGIIDLAPQAGSTYPNQYDNGVSALVIGLPVNPPSPVTFADGNSFLFAGLHVKVGDPRLSDLDDDGFPDLEEILCTSNPTSDASTCDDLDGDGLEFTPGGDDDEYINADSDGDGYLSTVDNCPTVSNPGQENRDSDPMGDACDPDDDNDGVLDGDDSCNTESSSIGPFGDHDADGCNDDTEDTDDDKDGISDVSDRDPTSGTDCSRATTGTGNDLDGDGCKDSEDPDQDGDGVLDADDNCDRNSNPNQEDTTEVGAGGSADGIGDACDQDKDGDGADATVPTGLPGVTNDPTAADCDDNDPDVGAPQFGLCQVDGATGPVGGVVDTIEQTVDDLVGGGAPSPGILVPLILYPECSSETPSDRCDDDPLDTRDSRDLDNDGTRNEPNGQMDIPEERVYYLGSDGLVDLVLLQPSPAFGPLPGTAVRLTVREPSADPVLAIIEQHLAPAPAGLSAFYCVHTHDATMVTVGQGATREEACAAPYDFTAAANSVGLLAGASLAGQLMTVPAQPLFQLTDENEDGVPDSIVIVGPDPASCAPVGSGPATRVKCSAYAAPVVVPLDGLPPVGPEALCPADVAGVLPFCVVADPCDDGDAENNPETCAPCEGDLADDEGCNEPDPCDDGNAENNPETCAPCEGDLANDAGCGDGDPCDPMGATFPEGCDPTSGLVPEGCAPDVDPFTCVPEGVDPGTVVGALCGTQDEPGPLADSPACTGPSVPPEVEECLNAPDACSPPADPDPCADGAGVGGLGVVSICTTPEGEFGTLAFLGIDLGLRIQVLTYWFYV